MMDKPIDEMTLEELKETPEYSKIRGRSTMSRDELAAAIQAERDNPSEDDDDEDAESGDVGVTEYDDNYVGVSPEYQNSASISNAPVSDGEDDPVMTAVKEHDENAKVPPPGGKSFKEWASENRVGNQVTRAQKS